MSTLNPPIVVTGAAGFVGARLVESLSRAGETLLSVDALEHFEARPEHKALDFGTKTHRDDLTHLLQELPQKPTAVFHLGACTDTTENDVELLNRLNLDYSKSLWNYCTKEKVPFFYASSAATYGDGTKGYDDDESKIASYQPLNPYGESKQQFDLWVLAQEKSGKTPPAWSGFKFFNVYGFGESHKTRMSSVVLQAFDQIRNSGRVHLFKSHRADIRDGDQRRDFIYVEDVVRVLTFASKHFTRGIYNLGTGRARSYAELVRAVFSAMNAKEEIDYIDMPEQLRGRYQYFTEAKISKLRAAGFTEEFHSLEDGVKKYVELLQRFYT